MLTTSTDKQTSPIDKPELLCNPTKIGQMQRQLLDNFEGKKLHRLERILTKTYAAEESLSETISNSEDIIYFCLHDPFRAIVS